MGQGSVFFRNLEQQRKEKGVSRRFMSEELHVDYSTYTRWEQGNREPGTDAIMDIADILEIPVGRLFCREMAAERRKNCRSEERKRAAAGE